MRFRLSDGRSAASDPWDAVAPAGLAAGMRAALAGLIRPQPGDSAHPLLSLRRRLTWVDAWERERLARAGTPEDVRRTWIAQAAHWRGTALFAARLDRWTLQVGCDDGGWINPSSTIVVTRVRHDDDLDALARTIWSTCERGLAHDRAVAAFGQWCAAAVLGPPRLVSDSARDDPDA